MDSNKMFAKYVSIMFLLPVLSFGQVSFDNFKGIAEFELRDTFTEETFLKLVREDKSISPELAYYHVLYLNNSLYKNSSDFSKNGFNEYRQKKNDLKTKLYEWALTLKEKLNSDKSMLYHDQFVEALDEYIKIVKTKKRTFEFIPAKIDTNKLNFVAARMLSIKIPQYSPDIDFSSYRKQMEQEALEKNKSALRSAYNKGTKISKLALERFKLAYLYYDKKDNNLWQILGITD